MNILEVEDKIKGLPDQMLFQEAQMPSGSVPQFLVISEIQRRAKMRQGAQKPPTQTVGEQVVQQGIASLAPPQQAPMPSQAMFAQGAPQQRTSPAQPMMMASGGVTKMQTGGMSPFGSGFDPNANVGSVIDMIYAQQMAQAQAQEEAAARAREMAEQRGAQMQEQARKDALSQALVGIGTGIARGDMAGGFAAGSQAAQGRMREARDAALRASERGEMMALSREDAARQARAGAQSFGAQQRLAQLTGGASEDPAEVRAFQHYLAVLESPNSTPQQRAAAEQKLGLSAGESRTPEFMLKLNEARRILADPNASAEERNWALSAMNSEPTAAPQETEAVRTARAYQEILLNPASPAGLKEKAKRELFGSDDGATAFDRKVESYRAAYPGEDEQFYLRAALGEIRAFQDPDTGRIQYEDVAGRFLEGRPAATSPERVQQETAERLAAERNAVFRGVTDGVQQPAPERRLTSATGPLQQVVSRGINTLTGAVTGAAMLPEVEASQEALDIIRKDMARQIATDDGNRLLATIYRDALSDMPTWYTSDSAALAKAEENIKRMDDGIANAEAILADENSTKEMRADASAALRSLKLNRQRLYELVTGQPVATGQSSVGPSEPTNKDSTEWRIWYYNYGPGAVDGNSP